MESTKKVTGEPDGNLEPIFKGILFGGAGLVVVVGIILLLFGNPGLDTAKSADLTVFQKMQNSTEDAICLIEDFEAKRKIEEENKNIELHKKGIAVFSKHQIDSLVKAKRLSKEHQVIEQTDNVVVNYVTNDNDVAQDFVVVVDASLRGQQLWVSDNADTVFVSREDHQAWRLVDAVELKKKSPNKRVFANQYGTLYTENSLLGNRTKTEVFDLMNSHDQQVAITSDNNISQQEVQVDSQMVAIETQSTITDTNAIVVVDSGTVSTNDTLVVANQNTVVDSNVVEDNVPQNHDDQTIVVVQQDDEVVKTVIETDNNVVEHQKGSNNVIKKNKKHEPKKRYLKDNDIVKHHYKHKNSNFTGRYR